MNLPEQFVILNLNAAFEITSSSGTANLNSPENERFVVRSKEVKDVNSTDSISENNGDTQSELRGEIEKKNKYIICGIDSPKRVGPLVPPKPYKKKQNHLEVCIYFIYFWADRLTAVLFEKSVLKVRERTWYRSPIS